jgi:hypothetical protein
MLGLMPSIRSWRSVMLRGIKPLQRTIVILSLLSLPILSGCVRIKPVYFNDSDKVFSGDANAQPPTPTFEWVLMSKGKYREITTVNPTP